MEESSRKYQGLVTIRVWGVAHAECTDTAVISVKPGLSVTVARELKAFSVQGHVVNNRKALTRG